MPAMPGDNCSGGAAIRREGGGGSARGEVRVEGGRDGNGEGRLSCA